MMLSRERNPRVGNELESQLFEQHEVQTRSVLTKFSAVVVGDVLWDATVDVSQSAYDTAYFISYLESGTLFPDYYGRYTLDDAIYLYECANNLDFLAERAASESNIVLKDFAINRATSYRSYYKSMAEAWHIAEPSGIKLSKAASDYISFQQAVFKSTLPLVFSLLVMIPCERLWPWLAKKMDTRQCKLLIVNDPDDSKKKYNCSNPFYFWIVNNYSNSGKIEKYVNQYGEFILQDDSLKEKAFELYKIGMTCELNFFRSAYDQPLEPITIPSYLIE